MGRQCLLGWMYMYIVRRSICNTYRYINCILHSCLKWITVTSIIVDWQLNVNCQCNFEIKGGHTVFGCLTTGILSRSKKKYHVCEAYVKQSLGLIFALHYARIQIEWSFLSLLAMKTLKQNFSTWNISIKLPPHSKYTRSYSRDWKWCLSSSCGIHYSLQPQIFWTVSFPRVSHTNYSVVLQ